MGENIKKNPEVDQGIATVEHWATTVLRKLQAEYDPSRPVLFLSDIDDTLFDTSLSWYTFFTTVATDMAASQEQLPSFDEFKSKGSRATFETVVGGRETYNAHRDRLLSNEAAHSDLKPLVDPQELQKLIQVVGVFGGYITGRPPQLAEITLHEISATGLPLAPVLHQPPVFEYLSGVSYKVTALSTLSKKLAENGFGDVKVIYLDDYAEMVAMINEQLHSSVQAIQFKGSLSDIETQIEVPQSKKTSLITRNEFDPEHGKGPRNWIYDAAYTNPSGHGEFLRDIFGAAIYPAASLTTVEELDANFAMHWLDLQEEWGPPTYSASALAALYFFCRDFLGPLKYTFTLKTLAEFAGTQTQIHFMARDAYSEYLIATHLKRSDQLENIPDYNYVPLSVRLMRQMDDPAKKPALLEYLRQFGFGNGGKHALVDVGFTGEIPHRLSQVFPDDTYFVRLLLSEADSGVIANRPVMQNATGFIFDKNNPNAFGIDQQQLTRTYRRMLENSFSGLYTSSTDLRQNRSPVRTNTQRYPDDTYNAVRRKLALRAIRDCVKIWNTALCNPDFGEVGLLSDRMLVSLISNFKQLTMYNKKLLDSEQIFVAHEPTNFDPSLIT